MNRQATKGLTPREEQVADLVIQDLSNQNIAEALGISVETVKEHVQNALRKTDNKTRTGLAVWALQDQQEKQSDLDRIKSCCKSIGLEYVVMEEEEFRKSYDPRRATGFRLFLGETLKENLHGRFLSFSEEGKFRNVKWQT